MSESQVREIVNPDDEWIDNGDGTWSVPIEIDSDLMERLQQIVNDSEQWETVDEYISDYLIEFLEDLEKEHNEKS